VEFLAPTFRRGRERWGTPRFWLCRRRAEVFFGSPWLRQGLRCLRMAAGYEGGGWATLARRRSCIKLPSDFLPVSADAGSLDCERSSARGRSFFARDDRDQVGSTSLVEFEAPTFRKVRERWGTPRLWLCRRSAGILRWESLASSRTSLSQDGGGLTKGGPSLPDEDPLENSLRLLSRYRQTRVPRLRKIVRERTIFLRSG